MEQGAEAGIAIHKRLREFPKSLDEYGLRPVSASDVPAMAAGLRRRATEGPSTADD